MEDFFSGLQLTTMFFLHAFNPSCDLFTRSDKAIKALYFLITILVNIFCINPHRPINDVFDNVNIEINNPRTNPPSLNTFQCQRIRHAPHNQQ